MNVLFVSDDDLTKSVVYDIHVLAEGLSLLGHNVYGVDCKRDNPSWSRTLEVDIARVHPEARVRLFRYTMLTFPIFTENLLSFSGRFVYAFSRCYKLAKRVIKDKKIDVIVTYSVVNSGLSSVRLARKFNIPVVFRNIDMLYRLIGHPTIQKAGAFFERRVYPRADKLLALTPKYAEYLIDMGAPESRVELLPFPVEMPRPASPGDLDGLPAICRTWREQKKQIIGFVGHFYEFSGLPEFLREFPHVIREAPDARLLLVGDGPIRGQLEAIVSELNLQEHVFFTGLQPFTLMPRFIQCADLCINAYPIDGAMKHLFSAKVVQYLACGKATVSSALAGMTDMIAGESCGVVYVNDGREMAREFASLLNCPERRKRLGQAGLEYVRRVHDRDAVALKFEAQLERAIEEKRARRAPRSARQEPAALKSDPLVSILTPVFNGRQYIEQCIQSVLNQTYPHVEHVFADGGSTDGTLEILGKYQKLYPNRIRFVSGQDNGVGSALNRAYRLARGDLFGWIDSDDRYLEHAVETAVNFFKARPNAFFAYGGCNLINERNEVTGSFVIKDFNRDEWVNTWHYIVFCATFFRREVLEQVGFVNDLGNDLDFFLRVKDRFMLHRLPGTLTSWRLHEGSISLKASAREAGIRKDRAKEDFFLVLKNRGSIFSPRALKYYGALDPSTSRWMPFMRLRPFRRLDHYLKSSMYVANRRNGSFVRPLLETMSADLKGMPAGLVRPLRKLVSTARVIENPLYNSAIDGFTFARAGQRINDVPTGAVVAHVSLYMDRIGKPSGVGSCVVRKVADDSIVGTLGTMDISRLPPAPATPAWVSFKANPVKIPSSGDYRIVFEWDPAGGDPANYPRVRYNDSHTIEGVFTYYNPSNVYWADAAHWDTSIRLQIDSRSMLKKALRLLSASRAHDGLVKRQAGS